MSYLIKRLKHMVGRWSRAWNHGRQLALWSGLTVFAAAVVRVQAEPAAARPRRVFAHYMVCFATYGESVESYQREIREAQSAGIDGFALNVGAWSGPETQYRRRVALLHDAAERLGSGFKLFFSLDLASVEDILDMVRTYGSRPSSLRHEDRLVLSTFGQGQLDWSGTILAPLAREGLPTYFVPFFWPTPVRETPDAAAAASLLGSWSNVVDGLFLFGAAGLPADLARSNAEYARIVQGAGKRFMAGFTPHYWGAQQLVDGRRYFETAGGEGTGLQWEALIRTPPDWVQLVTWNDFNESTYLTPAADPGRFVAHLRTPRRPSHAGYLELCRYYIRWYKSGSPPPIEQDACFFFYRTHPRAAVATTPDTPVTAFAGDPQDTVFLTTMLREPAEVRVHSGGHSSTHLRAGGIAHLRVPFQPGAQVFEFLRSGQVVARVEGPRIDARPAVYNFFPASGYGYW